MLFRSFLIVLLFMTSNIYAEVDISGYVDMEYLSPIDGNSEPEFDQHHISIIFQHETDIYKVLTELEWEHAASISASDGGNASGDGKIVVERAWGDINLSRKFNIRMGVILNSTIYQQNHFPSIVVNLTRPQMVKKIFDGSYEGLKFYGFLGENFNYDAWLTKDPKQRNGGSVETEHSGTSVGSRVGFNYKFNRDFYVNTSLLFANFNTTSPTDVEETTTETATGIEAEIVYNNITLWTEYGERKNPDATINNQRGLYAILSYSHYVGNNEFIPFFMYDSYRNHSESKEDIVRTGLGLTFRPRHNISFKSEYLQTSSYETTSTTVDSAQQLGFAFVYFF